MGRGMATYPGVGDFVYLIHCLKEKDYKLGCIGKHCQKTLSDAQEARTELSFADSTKV
jgi:hypothetical protein